jgi:hypothetical protein
LLAEKQSIEEESMNEYQVVCIRKPDRMSSHEHITDIGVATTKGTQVLDRNRVIQMIDGKEARFAASA